MQRQRSALIFSALMLACIAPVSRGQSTPFEGRTIVEVEYDPSMQPLDHRDLNRVQLLHAGSPLRAEDVAETIQRMFATGRYADIQVAAEPQGNGVLVRFITRGARFVGNVTTVGKISDPPSETQIINAARLNLGAPFEPDMLEQAQKNVQHLFTSNGLYEATVRLETLDDPQHEQTSVRIIVEPGPRARYSEPVIRGETKLPDSTIIRATGWRFFLIGRWRRVTESLTQQGLDGIGKRYQKEDRLTASVDLASLDYDPENQRAKATIDIDAGPQIRVTAVEANVSRRRMKRYVPVFQEGAVDDDLLVEGARNLRDYFQSRGYPDVDVTFRKLPPQADEQTIEYVIARGPRRRLVRVDIAGNRVFDRGTIRERLFIQPRSLAFRWGRYSEAFVRKDEQTIADLYKANGFRDVKVTSTLHTGLGRKSSDIGVTFEIAEGRQTLISQFHLDGVSDEESKALLPVLNSAGGQPYSDVSIGLDRGTVLAYFYAHGFRHASFSASAENAGPYRVNVTYTVQRGEQEFVRDILISGLKATDPNLVERNIRVKPGDPLSLAAQREAQRRLYNLGIFSSIDSAIQNSEGDETYKYVLFDFTEAHQYNLNVGLGAEIAQLGATTSNLADPTGGTGFSPRFTAQLNRINLWGIGHSATLETRLSNLEQRVGLNYQIPNVFDNPNRALTFSVLYDNARDIRTFASHRVEGSVQLSQQLTRATTFLVRFAYRRVSVSDVVIPTLLIPQFLQPVRIGIPSANLVQDRRDNPADPHRGIYNVADVGVASKIFGSQRSFTRILLRNATYHPLSRNVVLARQITFGAILPFDIPAGTDAADAVPLPERFFSGGNISHRGFPENQAGPRDTGSPVGPGGLQTEPTGFPLGGNGLLISNLELRFPLLGENIGGVLFWDAGNVYREVNTISFKVHQSNLQDFNYMVHAVGFGVRYRTPIGPIRIDLAYSINPPSFLGFKGTVQDLLACNPNLPPSVLPPQCQPVKQSLGHFQFFFSIGQTF